MAGRILGVHEDAAPAATAATYPGAGWGRAFVSNKGANLPTSTTEAKLIAMVKSAVRPWVDGGLGCVVSIKLDMAQVAKGIWDSRLQAVATTLAATRVILIIRHEQENDTKAAVGVAGSDRAYGVLKATAPALDVATCSMLYAWAPTAKASVRVSAADAKVWASAQRDIALADGYSGQSFPQGTLAEHPGFQRWIEYFGDGRIGVGERGWLLGQGRFEAIVRELDWLANDPVGRRLEVYIVWGTGGTEANAGWLLDDAAKAAIRNGFARLVLPTGYRPCGLDGFLVSERSGALVAADLTGQHDQLLDALRPN
jgi:hypothetical protein